jgi:predicted RNA polymerase sigma factor
MLQVVLGLDAARIAAAFLAKPSAMGQRLTRAKAKIRATRIRFDLPEPKELPERLEFVLEAIYAAYGSGWEDVAGSDLRRKGLAAEAINLGRLLVELMPSEPEALGLVALMLHCEAAAVAEAHGPVAGWRLLETIPTEAVSEYQPYWALSANLLKRMGRPAESAYNRAIGLCEDHAIRAFLRKETQRRGQAG